MKMDSTDPSIDCTIKIATLGQYGRIFRIHTFRTNHAAKPYLYEDLELARVEWELKYEKDINLTHFLP